MNVSKKWLQREGPEWVHKQIITREQYQEILKLYPESNQRITLVLPVLASILIGLGLLTFVASNWDVIPQIARLAILLATMVGFYTGGFYLDQKGHQSAGQGLMGLGVISFGGSMVLIGQMFHLIAYDARIFVLWSLAGLWILYLYRRLFFFFLSSALVLGGQVYAMSSFGQPSWILFGLTILGLGGFAYHQRNPVVGWVMAFLMGIQAIFLVIREDVGWNTVILVALGLYVLGIWLGEKAIAEGFLALPLAFGFAFSALMVFIHGYVYEEANFLANPVAFLVVFSILLFLGIWKRRGEREKLLHFILFLPFFYLPFGDIAYLVVMFAYASFLIYSGDQEHLRWRANIGVFLFLFSSFVGYMQLAWDFLNKSLFFLIGGLLLFVIHWVLRKRSRWMAKGGGKQ